jgi:ethanolamine ammonia-lyase large subunit
MLAMMGATSGAIAAGYSIVAKAAADASTIAVVEVKPREDIFAYVSRTKGKFDQTLYQQVIGAANAFKEGDQAIGVGAMDEASRKNARALLANTRIRDLDAQPLLVDDLQKLIWQTTDKDQYANVQDWTMGQLKEFLLTRSEAEIKGVMNGLTSDVIGCVPKLMSNEELIIVGQKIFNLLPGTQLGAKGIWAPASNPTPRPIIQRTSSGRSSTPSPMRPATSSSAPILSTARLKASSPWNARSRTSSIPSG